MRQHATAENVMAHDLEPVTSLPQRRSTHRRRWVVENLLFLVVLAASLAAGVRHTKAVNRARCETPARR